MDPLVNAEIFANDVTRYHRLYEANIQINGRLDYEGAASKTYVDAIGKEWPIRLNDLSVDTANRTVGHGLVRAGEELFLSPEFCVQRACSPRGRSEGLGIRRWGPNAIRV